MRTMAILLSLNMGLLLLGTGSAQDKGGAQSLEKLDGKWYVVRQE